MGHAVGEATRRSVEPVRRVTARAGSAPVAASGWEHVEVILAEDAEVVSSLVLEQDSTFRAKVFRRSGEEARLGSPEPEQPTLGPERQAFGCWRPCGKGVELVLAEEVDLGLEELVILYRHRRGCLVAEETSLPDGLSQAGMSLQVLKTKRKQSCAGIFQVRTRWVGGRRVDEDSHVLCMVSHGAAVGATLNSVPEARTKSQSRS